MLQAVNISRDSNRRTDTRLDICLKVDVTYENGQQFSLCTRNMSTTGLFLETGEHTPPSINSTIEIQISPELGLDDAPRVRAKVVRITDDGFGITFLGP